MPNKLTDAEVKKAFESCFTDNNNCDECPYYSCKDNRCTQDGDVYTLPKMIIDLINRQEGENEKNENIIRIADKTIATLNAENESLKAEVERLQKSIELTKGAKCVYSYDGETLEFCTTSPCPISKTVDQIKTEAYKEFATKTTDKVEKAKQKYERLCKEQGEKMEEHMHIHFNGIIKIAKDLLNELVGDGDA